MMLAMKRLRRYSLKPFRCFLKAGIWSGRRRPERGKRRRSHCRVQLLVLTPTRELAIQVAEAFHTYAKHLGRVRVLPVYGGQSISQQIKHLKSGVQVIVGTPGRVMDHMRRETIDLGSLKMVVLD